MTNNYFPQNVEEEALLLKTHRPCLECPYNKSKILNKPEKVYVFDCTADPDIFPCSYIPELYPHKLLKLGNGLDSPIPNVDKQHMSLFEVVFRNTLTVEDTFISSMFVANNRDQVKNAVSERLEGVLYGHLRLYSIRNLKEIDGYKILVVPPKIDRVCYPKFVLDVKGRSEDAVELEELNLEVERHPALSSDEEDKVIIRVVTNDRFETEKEAE